MRRHAEAGLTLIETLVALVLVATLTIIPVYLLLPATQSDNNAKQRTLAVRAAETWLDRYRANQEPKSAVAGYCTVSGSVTTCAYPYNYTYPITADFIFHDAKLASIMSPFRHVVTITYLANGVNVSEYEIKAQVFWKDGAKERSTLIMTRVAY